MSIDHTNFNAADNHNITTTGNAPHRLPHHQRPDHQRVVITGMGAITPLGNSVADTWQAMLAGKSGIRRIEHFDVSDFRSQIAGTVIDFNVHEYMTSKDARRYDTFMHYGLASCAMALADAGLLDQTDDFKTARLAAADAHRVGVVFGSGIGGVGTIEDTSLTLADKGAKKVSPFVIPGSIVNMPAGLVAIQFGLKGANLATSTACTTSTHAIGVAARLIAYGDADVMVVGGSEKASTPVGMSGFAAMHALSTRNDEPTCASRPFDVGRDGFVLSDGAGAMVLESLAHAKTRGAVVLAEVAGFGMSDDASHITAPPDNGEGASRAMMAALNDAGIEPYQIGYINAHGTSTPVGDVAESQAITSVFSQCERMPAVSSTKSMTGHLLGAAGVVEAIATVKALQDQQLPPTINLDNPDPKCALDHIAHTARAVQNLQYAISNSFGFGGTNGSLVLAKWLGA